MITVCCDDRKYFKSEILSGISGLKHAFATANGGLSTGKIEGLNLGFNCGDDRESVLGNYRLAARDLEIPFEKIIASKQTHSANIRIVTERDAGIGVSRAQDMTDVDGLMTDCAGLPLVIFYADCVPVLLADRRRRAVAAVHSGWRGTAAGIAPKAAKMLCEVYGSRPEDICAAIGPSIGKCCFEVGGEVAEIFEEKYRFPKENGKFTVDLQAKIRDMLAECGVPAQNIDIFGLCTVCSGEKLFSYRRQKSGAGRMGAFIMLE